MTHSLFHPATEREHPQQNFSTLLDPLQAEADNWLTRYHHRRLNHSDYMRGRTPAQILASYRTRRAS
jgi:hypothetical protein